MLEASTRARTGDSAETIKLFENTFFFQMNRTHNRYAYSETKTTAGVYKILCPQHLLVPKYGQICSVVIPQNILDFAQTFNR